MISFIVFLLWLGELALVGAIAHSKGRDRFRWGLAALVFGPFILVLVLLADPINELTDLQRRRERRVGAILVLIGGLFCAAAVMAAFTPLALVALPIGIALLAVGVNRYTTAGSTRAVDSST